MSLFDIRLNEEGISSIRKFEKFTKWVMALIIIMSCILLLEAWTTYFLTKKEYLAGNKLREFQTLFYPYYLMIHCVLVYIQVHYYVKTGRQLSFAIDNNDEQGFNRSFSFLLRNAVFAVLALSFSLAMELFRIITFIVPAYY